MNSDDGDLQFDPSRESIANLQIPVEDQLVGETLIEEQPTQERKSSILKVKGSNTPSVHSQLPLPLEPSN
jgi:hypothetical protein